MAFSGAAPSGILATDRRHGLSPRSFEAAGLGAVVTLLIAAPWLRPGYLFGTDWPGPRRFDWPAQVSSAAAAEISLAALSSLIGGEATGKVLVVAILFAAGALAYRAIPADSFAARAAAASLFVVNPFVYGRLHYGQLFLLAGYALLPWTATRLRALCASPSWINSLLLGVSVALVGVFTAHLVLVAAVMAVAVTAAYAVVADRRTFLAAVTPHLALSAVAALVLSSYWVVPFLLGKGSEAAVIAGTGGGELQAYRAVPDPALGLLPNLLGLYGFWAEASGRFTSMKDFVPAWPVILCAILAVCAAGVVSAWRGKDRSLRPWVAGLVAAGAVAVVLEAGVSSPLTSPPADWLDSHLALYRGMRDAGKWASLLALAYSQLLGLGVDAVLTRLAALRLPDSRLEWLHGAAVTALIAVPLFYGNGVLFGAHGEIRPSAYPTGWYQADHLVASDPGHARALFLPWHLYMSYSFVRNENNVIASPAPAFFSVPVLVSPDPEIPGTAPPANPDQQAVGELVRARPYGDWAGTLRARGIRYILLAHELDWQTYAFLDGAPGIEHVGLFQSIDVYRIASP